MQAEKVQTCYICKIKFVCPCWEEKVQLKERCCALGKVEYISRMYDDSGVGIIHIHLCSKKC